MIDRLNITIRPLTAADEPFLWEMLYQALYVPEGAEPLPRDIVKRPEICRYVQNWGNSDDIGFIAIGEVEQRPMGAVWIRLLTGENRGYGYVNDRTPELSIAVLSEYQTRGVGTRLLIHLLKNSQTRYQAISLSVSSDNPAVRLYQRLGFETVESIDNSLTMVKRLSAQDHL
jgi:ribosomal protein S18 acetylase RimI-like enzyme